MGPYLAVILAAVCFGTTGTAQAFGPADASPTSVGAARIVIGGGILALLAGIGWLRTRRAAQLRMAPPPGPRAVLATRRPRIPSWIVLVIGALGVVAYQPAFFAGTSAGGVAVGTVVALGSAPVITGLLDGLLHRRFPGVRWSIATATALVGVTLISGLLGAGTPSGGPASASGVLASLGAGASYAVYTLASKTLLDRGWTPSTTMGAMFGTAAALSIPLLLATDTAWLLTGPGILTALWLGLVATAVAYTLFGWGLRRLPAATVSTLTLAEPLVATVLGTLVLGQLLAPAAVAGLVVLAAALVVLTVPLPVVTPKGAASSR